MGTTPRSHPFTTGEVEHYRKDLLLRGGGFAERLADILAGKDVDLSDFPLLPAAGETPEDRLHRMLGLVDEALHRIALGCFGRCTVCNQPIPHAVLDLAPWTARCADCEHPLEHGRTAPAGAEGAQRWQHH